MGAYASCYYLPAGAEAAFAHTVQYTKDRKAFGKPIGAFQNTRFKLAELRTEIDFCRTYLDRCMELQLDEKLSVEAAAAAKYKISDMFSKVVDECLQLHGGYGYMLNIQLPALISTTEQTVFMQAPMKL